MEIDVKSASRLSYLKFRFRIICYNVNLGRSQGRFGLLDNCNFQRDANFHRPRFHNKSLFQFCSHMNLRTWTSTSHGVPNRLYRSSGPTRSGKVSIRLSTANDWQMPTRVFFRTVLMLLCIARSIRAQVYQNMSSLAGVHSVAYVTVPDDAVAKRLAR